MRTRRRHARCAYSFEVEAGPACPDQVSAPPADAELRARWSACPSRRTACSSSRRPCPGPVLLRCKYALDAGGPRIRSARLRAFPRCSCPGLPSGLARSSARAAIAHRADLCRGRAAFSGPGSHPAAEDLTVRSLRTRCAAALPACPSCNVLTSDAQAHRGRLATAALAALARCAVAAIAAIAAISTCLRAAKPARVFLWGSSCKY